MWALSHTRSRKSGIGTVLATVVFVFIMTFTAGNLLVWSIIQASNYQIVTDEMRERDFNRQSESLKITDAIFGGSGRFTAGTSNSSTSTIGSDWPIQNMNISSTSGWTFNKIMPSGVAVGFSGSFDTLAVGTGAVGSPSGAGVLFMGLSFNQSLATFKGNWSTNFYVDPSRYSSSGYIPSNAAVVASWTHHLPIALWNPAIQTVRSNLYLINQSGRTYVIDSKHYTDVTSADVAWNYSRNLKVTNDTAGISGGFKVPRAFWGKVGKPQWVTLTISVTVTSKIANSDTEFRIYFDDIGVRFDYPASVTTADYPFTLLGNATVISRGLILRMDASFARAYSVANVHQIVYMYDYDLKTWITISDAFISQSSVNITIPITGLDIPRFVSTGNQSKIRIYSSSLSSSTASSSSVSLGYFYSDLNKVSIIFANTGPFTAHAVSLWIIDPAGQRNFNSTTSTRFDLQIGAGKTGVNATLSFTWTRGVNNFRVTTERGNIISFQKNA